MQVLDLKTGVDFGAKGNLKEFSPTGFSPEPDAVSTWSEAPVAQLIFRLPPMPHDLQFTIEVFPYLVDEWVPRQEIWVFFNGLFTHYQSIKAPVEMSFTVPRELFNARANRFSFALPNAASPSELGLGTDMRKLGLAFVKLGAADPRNAAVPARSGPQPGAAAGPRRPQR